MLELFILMLDIIEKDPDNDVNPLIRELANMLRHLPVWQRKAEWKRLRLALKHRFHDKISATELLERVREHLLDVEEKIKG